MMEGRYGVSRTQSQYWFLDTTPAIQTSDLAFFVVYSRDAFYINHGSKSRCGATVYEPQARQSPAQTRYDLSVRQSAFKYCDMRSQCCDVW